MKSPVAFCFCLILFCFSVNAQCKSDKERAIQRAKLESNKAENYKIALHLFRCYEQEAKPDSALIFAKKIYEIGKNQNNLRIWLEGYFNMAKAHLGASRLDSTEYYFKLILDKTKRSTDHSELEIRAITFLHIGAMFKDHNLGDEAAFTYFRNAIDVSKQVNQKQVYIRSTVAIIDDLFARKEYDEIPELLANAYEFLDESISEDFAYKTLNKAKANYLSFKATTELEKKEAMNFMLSEYEKADEQGDEKHRVFLFIDIVKHFLYKIPKNDLTAMAELNFKVAKDKLNGSAKGGLYEAYAKVLLNNLEFGQAIPFLKVAKTYLEKSPNLENYKSVCEDLMVAYEKTGQLEKVIPVFNDYKMFQDSFVAVVYADKLLDLQEKYKTEKKDRKNLQLVAQNDVIKTRFLLSTIIGILLFLFLFAGIFFFQNLKKNKKELEKMNEEKNKLFAILAHDLRNPIASLSNLAGKVKYLTENNRLNELDELAENTDSKLRALNDNLNNILFWAITESNLIEIKQVQVSLYEEINKINELYANGIAKKEIIIKNTVSDSIQVRTDITVIQTILRNLIANAIKFSHTGGAIKFATSGINKIEELHVIDYGLGLKDNSGVSVNSKNNSILKNEGTGIGLKICQELASKSKLTLNLVNNPEGGTIGIIRFGTTI